MGHFSSSQHKLKTRARTGACEFIIAHPKTDAKRDFCRISCKNFCSATEKFPPFDAKNRRALRVCELFYVKFLIFARKSPQITKNKQRVALTDEKANGNIIYCVNMDKKQLFVVFVPKLPEKIRFWGANRKELSKN